MASAATVPTVAGMAELRVAAGRLTAVLTPMMPKSTIPAIPIQRRLMARMPMMTAKMASATTVPRMSMGLSLVPNWRIAMSLTATGTWSMTHSPTDTIGEVVPRSSPLTSWATPRAAPAAARPASAPCHHRIDGAGGAGGSPAGGSRVTALGVPMPTLRGRRPGRITTVRGGGRDRRHWCDRGDAVILGGCPPSKPSTTASVIGPRCGRRSRSSAARRPRSRSASRWRRENDLFVVDDVLRADGEPVEVFLEPDGSSIAWFHTDGSPITVTYEATVDLGARRGPEKLTPSEILRYTSPSRYCPSDAMSGFAASMFGPVSPVVDDAVVDPATDHDQSTEHDQGIGIEDDRAHDDTGAAAGDVIGEVAQWVNGHLSYEFGASTGTTTAADTLLSAAGVCRDFTHLAVCLLRGLNIPARYVAAYAPGLDPQDFHALVEAHDGARWRLFDATGLSDPTFAVRIATGVDSAEAPFMTVLSGDAPVGEMQIWAGLDPR